LDYVNGGDLYFHLKRKTHFSEKEAKFYGAELLLALSYLHYNGFIYRDMKPENILIDAEGHARLTDFGLSKEFDINDENLNFTFCGTP
jgi:serine/threonine protein kinase